MPLRRISLTVSILAFLSCLLMLTWLLFTLLAYKTTANDLYSQKAEHAGMLLATFVQQLPPSIPGMSTGIISNNAPAAVFAQNISTDNAFIRLTLLDPDGKAIFTVGKEDGDIYLPFGGFNQERETGCKLLRGEVHCIAKLGQGSSSETSATAGLALSLNNENNRLARSKTLYMAYFAIDFILLLGLGAFILSRMVVTPLHRLLSATEKITCGHYGQRISISGSAELTELAESFNAMSTTLRIKEQQVNQHLEALQKINCELSQAREETLRTEKMASIGLLAAGMAHEIGTPLASIIGYAELAGSEELDTATIQEYARRISADCTRIDRIVRGLLQYATPQGTTVERCDIISLLEETLTLLREQGVFKNMHVSLIHSDDTAETAADPHQLQQVLINLLINSRDAMTQGTGQLSITITNETDRNNSENSISYVKIDVSDNGTGIPEEHLSKIFDPFFTTKEPGKGTGLGLAISSKIIESFGGKIHVSSKTGEGTSISLLLPAAAPTP